MHVLVYILLWTTVCCYRCFHERQSYKRARPIGWLDSNERKYCQLKQGMYCEKILSRFWEIYHLIEYHISLSLDSALSTVFFDLCFYECQADKPARPIGWLGSCEKKYCLLGAGKELWKNFEPFWRNVTSKIVFSCMFLSIYCYERLFAIADVSMNANRTNESGQLDD